MRDESLLASHCWGAPYLWTVSFTLHFWSDPGSRRVKPGHGAYPRQEDIIRTA